MREIICSRIGYFDGIKIAESSIPEPKDNQVQISVKAVSLSVSDFKPFVDMIEKGKVSITSKLVVGKHPLGGDVSGVITKVGKNVSGFKIGDEIYASIGVNGGCAEYIVTDADKVCLKPQNLSFEEAAAIPTFGIVAMEACEKAKLHKDAEVLVYGSSGGVGQFAVMIAKTMGCNVTAVCSTRNVENAYNMEADRVIDYKKEHISNCKNQFDAIFGVNGNISLSTYKRLLKKGGTYVAIGGKQATSGLIVPLYSFGSGKHMTFVVYASAVKHGHLKSLKDIAEENKLHPFLEKICKPVEVSGVLEEICHNHTKGKIVVTMAFK